MFKCPSCSKTTDARNRIFSNWDTVRNHFKICKNNTGNEFIVCSYYGVIPIENLNVFNSTRELKKVYPDITISDGFLRKLRKTGVLKVPIRVLWSKEKIIESIKEFVKLNNRIPQTREFDQPNLSYPCESTIREHFGTFNEAIKEAGFDPSYLTGFGERTKAKDGNFYRSKSEAYFVDNYLHNKYEYQYELPYGNGWLFDFYLPELDLYIEINGKLDQDKIDRKISYCKDKNINLKVILATDLYIPNRVQLK